MKPRTIEDFQFPRTLDGRTILFPQAFYAPTSIESTVRKPLLFPVKPNIFGGYWMIRFTRRSTGLWSADS